MMQLFARNARFVMVLATVMMALTLTLPHIAKAADPGSTENCTNFKELREKAEDGKPGILTNIVNMLKDVVNDSSKKLYHAFIDNDAYQMAVNAAITLMIVIYGIAFMIGVVQPSFGQVLVRLFKIGVIYAMISPDGWEFFSDYAVKFFDEGTDELIRGVLSIGTGTTINPGDSPFIQLDGIAKWVISPDMIIAMVSVMFASGPYPMAFGGLMAFAFMGVIKLLLEALKTYGISLIMRALLLGVAPIFIVFLLFDRTKQLFTGWLNSLVNLSVQPILYFTFISFFIVLIQSAAFGMLGANTTSDEPIEFCWTEAKKVEGSPNKQSFWRVKMPGSNAPDVDTSDWKGPLSCALTNKTVGGDKCKEFPINIIDILSFLILVYVAQQFSGVITRLSSEISNAFVNLDTQSKMDFGQDRAKQQQPTTSTNGNVPAGGQEPGSNPPAPTTTQRPTGPGGNRGTRGGN